ncbi:hypothetical protein NIES25_47290 [Nostoc linckia NIES-25]|nr:hypothetical protein NIES25_47290 [Nostoc linckia NIES-25]
MNQEIWILYQNEPGMPRRVIGTFSTPEKAITCKAIRGQIDFNRMALIVSDFDHNHAPMSVAA